MSTQSSTPARITLTLRAADGQTLEPIQPFVQIGAHVSIGRGLAVIDQVWQPPALVTELQPKVLEHQPGVIGTSSSLGSRGIIPTDEFKREDRYIVIKRKDLNAAPFAALHSFLEHLQMLGGILPPRQFLVIESDWPEYETTWRMIERRMTSPSAEEKAPRLGREWWDRLCALPCHMFLLKPSGTGVQKLEDPSGNWIDVHDAQRLRDGAQSDINELRGEVERLRAGLKFYADREHYYFESGNWDTVSGEPLNILWCGEEPDFIEDGTVARAALAEGAKS